jgi:hypothetical protein
MPRRRLSLVPLIPAAGGRPEEGTRRPNCQEEATVFEIPNPVTVLVAYAGRHGATVGIAERIAVVLRESGPRG